MTGDPLHPLEINRGAAAYTHLFACIIEDDDGFTVQVRLYNNQGAEDAAWGEEVADCIESAAELIAGLAARFMISPKRIEIEWRTADLTGTTRH